MSKGTKNLHTELGISDARMEQMRDQVIERINELKDDYGDSAFYSQVVAACAQVPNDMEEAILIGMIVSRAMMSMEISRIPILGTVVLDFIKKDM